MEHSAVARTDLRARKNGSVLALNASGQLVREGQLMGTPTCIAVATNRSGSQRIVFGTSQGRIKLFQATE